MVTSWNEASVVTLGARPKLVFEVTEAEGQTSPLQKLGLLGTFSQLSLFSSI